MQPLIDLVPLTLKIGAYADNVVKAELQTEAQTYYAALALGVQPFASRLDHFVSLLKHNDYNAVSGDDVPLSAIAFNQRATTNQQARGLCPFPGELNDVNRILLQMALAGSSPDSAARVRLATFLPCTPYPLTVWPIVGGKKFEITLNRFASGSAITELVLWAIRLPRSAFTDACNLAGLPHWVGKKKALAAAAGATAREDAAINPGDKWGLRLRQIFAVCYNAADNTYSETHLNAVKGRMLLDDREIYPAAGAERLQLGSLYSQGITEFDCARDPRLLIPAQRKVRHELETLVTVGDKDLRLTHYGTLQPTSLNDGPKKA